MPAPGAAVLLVAGLTAPPETFETFKEDEHCRYLASRPDHGGWPTLRAECLWPEIPTERLEDVLGEWSGYANVFSTVETSDVVGPLGNGTAVHHVHTAPLMVDREALLLFWREETGSQTRFHWTLAPGQPGAEPGRVQLVRDTGFWTVAPNPEGTGSLVISELTYDPGGRFPEPIVRWFQTLGVPIFVGELRAAATP